MSLCESSDGIVFPNLDNSSKPPSKRSTTTTARSIYQTAIDAAADNENKSSFQIPPNKKWRYGYQPTVVHTSHLMTAHSSNPLTMARAALQHAHTTFQFRRSGFPEMSLQEACTQDTFTGSFVTGDSTSSTATSAASSTTSTDPCFTGVPYRGKEYRGAELIDLAQSFADYGQAEPSFALAIKNIMNTDTLKKGLADKVFILIGATSEMGPTQSLLDLGATVIALARPSSKRDPDKWKRLINKAVNSSGTMLYPTRSTDASVAGAGADALVDTPEIINWLCELSNSHPMVQNKQMYIYSGIYLDGGMFVRASMAMEMIISELTKRLIQIPNLIYIDTPSHAHIVDLATYTGGIDQQQHAPFLMKLMASCGIIKKNKCILNPSGRKDVVVMNMLATQQGPNYALAKFIQRFRAIWSRHSETLLFPNDQNKDLKKAKQLVSITLGPGAKTESVMHSSTMAMVMNTMDAIKPNVAHEPETVQTMMTLIMINDITSKTALGNPNVNSTYHTDFLVENAWHGGMWRSPYSMDSVGMYCIGMHYVSTYLIPLLLMICVYVIYMIGM